MEAPKTNHRANTDGNNSIDFFLDSLSNLNIGTQSVQELFFVNKKPLEAANGAYQSIVKP